MKLRTVYLMPDDRPMRTHQQGDVIRQPIGEIGHFPDPRALRDMPQAIYRATGELRGGCPVFELDAIAA